MQMIQHIDEKRVMNTFGALQVIAEFCIFIIGFSCSRESTSAINEYRKNVIKALIINYLSLNLFFVCKMLKGQFPT